MGRSRNTASPGDTPRAGMPRALTLMLGWALSVLTRLCNVSKPSLMLKRLFCSAEMCVMRRLSICGQALSGTSWQRGGGPWAACPIGDGLAPSSQRGGEFEGQQERAVQMDGDGAPERRQHLILPYLAGLRPALTGHRVVQGDASTQPHSRCRGSLAGLGPVTAWKRKGDALGRGAAAAPPDGLTPGSCTGAGGEEQPRGSHPAQLAGMLQSSIQPHLIALSYPKSPSFYSCSEMGTLGG